jgi:hypothetical protein
VRVELDSRRRRALLALAAVAILAGVLIAILTAPGGSHHRRPARRAGALALTAPSGLSATRGVNATELTLAAAYLGLTRAQVRRDLRAGHSLAHIAASTPRHSTHGLLEALIVKRVTRLERERTSGRLTPQRAALRIARIRRRALEAIERAGS